MSENIIAPASNAGRYLTLREVGERLKCSRSTVWRLANERGLRAVRSGGLVRIRESDLAAWLERHTTTSNGNAEGGERA